MHVEISLLQLSLVKEYVSIQGAHGSDQKRDTVLASRTVFWTNPTNKDVDFPGKIGTLGLAARPILCLLKRITTGCVFVNTGIFDILY